MYEPSHRRAPAARAQVYLDVNAVPSLPFFVANDAWDGAQCDVQSISPSPSGGMLAYCVDGSGYETYDVRLKDLAAGEEMEESIKDTAGSIAWAGDGALFYTRHDAAHRPFQVRPMPSSPPWPAPPYACDRRV